MSLANDIAHAMDRGELFLNYLPTLSLRDAHCIGAEALVRWRRRKAVLRAAAFIPFIENTPVSGMITNWVVDTIAAELGKWLDDHPDAHISINVPPEILGGLAYASVRPGLPARVHQLVLEINGRGIPDRLGFDAIQALAKRGVRIALDDAVLSRKNLALMDRCNLAMLKLDRELTWQLEPEKPKPEWFDGLAAMLKSGPLQVVAEGVESEYQAEQLKTIGVQMAQGYLFSAPLTARQLMHFHAERPTQHLA